jgi:hypothetical protein
MFKIQKYKVLSISRRIMDVALANTSTFLHLGFQSTSLKVYGWATDTCASLNILCVFSKARQHGEKIKEANRRAAEMILESRYFLSHEMSIFSAVFFLSIFEGFSTTNLLYSYDVRYSFSEITT